jgi:ribosomal protein S18 acetylase RimI-like enzyme
MATLREIRATSPYAIRLATSDDIPVLQGLRREAAAWIRETSGVSQWAKEYPEELFRQSIANGETYMVDLLGNAVASVTISFEPDARKWNENFRRDPAVYVSKLMVARSCKGMELGAELLDFAEGLGYCRGVTWGRLDAWTTNEGLHEYYEELGFSCLRIIESDRFDSGAIFQRPTYEVPYIGTQIDGVEQFLTRDV